MKPRYDQRSVHGVSLDVEQVQAAVDDGQQTAEVVSVGSSRVSFDPRGRVVRRVDPVFLQSTPVIPSALSNGISTHAKPDERPCSCGATRAERSTTSSVGRTMREPTRRHERVRRLRRQFSQGQDRHFASRHPDHAAGYVTRLIEPEPPSIARHYCVDLRGSLQSKWERRAHGGPPPYPRSARSENSGLCLGVHKIP